MLKRFDDIKAEDRPRERFTRFGAGQLKTEELIQILLGSGIKGSDVRSIAKKITKILEANREVTEEKLKDIKGLGQAKISLIISAIELGRRQNYDAPGDVTLITPEKIWEHMVDIRGGSKEYFVVFYLNSRDRMISREVMSIGTLNASMVHPREVFEIAIRNKAGSIIGVHNHPSKSVEPSDADISITKRLVEAGKILGIEFYDHIIVTEPKRGDKNGEKFYSIRENFEDLFD